MIQLINISQQFQWVKQYNAIFFWWSFILSCLHDRNSIVTKINCSPILASHMHLVHSSHERGGLMMVNSKWCSSGTNELAQRVWVLIWVLSWAQVVGQWWTWKWMCDHVNQNHIFSQAACISKRCVGLGVNSPKCLHTSWYCWLSCNNSKLSCYW